MDAAAKNRKKNQEQRRHRCLDSIHAAIHDGAGAVVFRNTVIAALKADCSDADIGSEVRLASLALVKAG